MQTCRTCEFWVSSFDEKTGECDQTNVPEPVVAQRIYQQRQGCGNEGLIRFGHDLATWTPADTDEFVAVLVTPPDFGCTSWQAKEEY